MSTMSVIDLQCQEAQETFTAMLEVQPDISEEAAIEVLVDLTHYLTPVEAWPVTVPYMLNWAWLEFAFALKYSTLH